METNIAVGIDPTDSQIGSREVERALKKIEAAAERSAVNLDDMGDVARQALRKVKDDAEKAANKAKTLGGRFDSLKSKLTSIKGLIAIGGIGFLGKQFLDVSVEIDTALKSISVATGATGQDLKNLQEVASNVFTDVPGQIQEVTAVIGSLNTLTGAQGDTLEDLSRQVIEASNLLGESGQRNAELLGKSLEQWQRPADEGADTLDRLFVLTQKYGVGLGEVISQLNEYGSVLQNAGFSLEETAELQARLNASGISWSRISPGLNASFRRWAANNQDLRTSLVGAVKEIGEAQTKTEGLAKATEVFGAEGAQRLLTAINNETFALDDLGSSMDNAQGIISQTTEETRSFSDIISIVSNNLLEKLTPSLDSTISLLEDFNDLISDSESQKTFSNLIEKNQSLIKDFGIDLSKVDPENLADVNNVLREMIFHGRDLKEEVSFSGLRDDLSFFLDELRRVEGTLESETKRLGENSAQARELQGEYDKLTISINKTSEKLRDLGIEQDKVQETVKAPSIDTTIVTKVDIKKFKESLLTEEQLLEAHFEKQRVIAQRAFGDSASEVKAKNEALLTLEEDHRLALTEIRQRESGFTESQDSIDALRESLLTELDVLEKNFEDKQFIAEEAFQNLQAGEKEKNSILLAIEQEHLDAVAKLKDQDFGAAANDENIDAIRESLLTERQVLSEHLQERQFQIEDAFQTEGVSLEEKHSLLLRLEEQYQDDLTKITEDGIEKRTNFEKLSASQQFNSSVGSALNIARSLSSIAKTEDRESFDRNKTLQKSLLAISIPSAIMRGYSEGGYYGALAAAAAGAVQLYKVNTAQYGGGAVSNVGGGGGGGGGGLTQTGITTQPITQIAANSLDERPPVQVVINGNVFGVDDLKGFVEEAVVDASSSDRITVRVVNSNDRVRIT